MPSAKYGVAYELDIFLVDRSTGQFKSSPTIATGDFKVSKDNGTLTNLTTLPTVSPASGPIVRVQLSASEMTANKVTIVAQDAAGAEWNDVMVQLEPQTSSDIVPANMVQIDGQNTSGNNATLYLKQLNINNSTGIGIVVQGGASGGAGQHAISVIGGSATSIGNNGGDALRLVGGNPDTGTGGSGIHAEGGGSNGVGINATADATSGYGVKFTGGNGNVIKSTGYGYPLQILNSAHAPYLIYGALSGSVGSVSDTNSIANGILDQSNGVYSGVTPRKALKLLTATQGGKTNGGGTSTFNVRDPGDTKNVVTATVDSDGNRSSVTLDLT